MLWLKIRPQGGTKELSLRLDARDVDEGGSWSCGVCDAAMLWLLARIIVDERWDSLYCSVFLRFSRFCSIRSLLGG